MATIDLTATLAELVIAKPAPVAHLDPTEFDYRCCGQRR